MIWRLRDLRKTYRTRRIFGAGRALDAVDSVSLEVAEGDRLAILGESGAGKTTLALAGLGLIGRDGGTVELFGEDTARWSARRWTAARRRAQLLLQDPLAALDPHLPLRGSLEQSAAVHGHADPRRAAAEALDDLGLATRAGARPRQLSGGEQRRAGIARLLLARPRLVVLDEPTTGLEADLKVSVLTMLLERVGPACAVVLVTHDLPLAAWCCRRAVVMRSGRLVDAFAVEDLRAGRPRAPYTRALLEASGMRSEAEA